MILRFDFIINKDELKNVNRQRRNHRIRRSRSRSGGRNSERKADTAYIREQPSGSNVKPTSLEKRKSNTSDIF